MSHFDSYSIKRLRFSESKDFVCRHHYSHGCHNGPKLSLGLFNGQVLIGVCMFSTPCSENVRASVFGPDEKDAVIELSRLVVLDEAPHNTESWFVSRCLHTLKTLFPTIHAVLSFADPTQGHVGTIYQAMNFRYTGTSSSKTFYRDVDGRLRHPRQCGKNISRAAAAEMGWTAVASMGKHRYIRLLPDNKRHLRELSKRCLLNIDIPYPKRGTG